MNVTIDLATVLVAVTAVAVGCWIYQRMTPATEALDAVTSKGERLAVAVTAAAAVIGIGAFVVGGITFADTERGIPATGPTVTHAGSVPQQESADRQHGLSGLGHWSSASTSSPWGGCWFRVDRPLPECRQTHEERTTLPRSSTSPGK